jgi:hypothetical protein
MPRGRISKLGIKDGDRRVIFIVPEAFYPALETEAHALGLSVNEFCRRRSLGPAWNPPRGATLPPRPYRPRKPGATHRDVPRENNLGSTAPRELTVEYDGEASR